MVIGILVVVGIVNPYLSIPTVIVIMVFFKVRYVYMTTTRNIKRLEGVSKYCKLGTSSSRKCNVD